MKYGLAGGAAMITWTLGEYAVGAHNTRFTLGQYTGWGVEVILFVTLWRMLRSRIAGLESAWLPAWEGMLHGALASFVAGLLFYTFLNLYVVFINPEWTDLYLEWQVARMRSAGETEQAVRAFVLSFRWMSGPLGLATLTMGLYTILGGVFSAVATVWLNFLRKKPALTG